MKEHPLLSSPYLSKATLSDYPTIQNMARFYFYDISRYCGGHYEGWECPQDGLYECHDYRHYFEEDDRWAFFIKVGEEIAGFALIRKDSLFGNAVDWVLGEFFILGKFQGKSIGRQVVHQLFEKFPGTWELSVIEKNTPALHFWRKIAKGYESSETTKMVGDYTKIILKIDVRNPFNSL